jgi:membrane protein YdbS with pleckstrin-like domain
MSEQHSLDVRYIDVRRIVGLIFAAVVSTALMVVLAIVGWSVRPGWQVVVGGGGAWLALTIGLAVWYWRWPVVVYRHAAWQLDEHMLEIRRGVIWRRIINVPRSRVQHTDVSEGPLERSHGLSTLIVHTAGTEFARVALPGLSRETAIMLRDQLLPRDGRDAV